MKNPYTLILFSIFSLYFDASALASQTSAPIVVELFTSQGCSSCPPADTILDSLSQNPNIIALGCHVTYWDRLNWKDTLGQDFCDMRQHGYISIHDQTRVYTPQMVVNGGDGFVGSRESEVTQALKSAENTPLSPILVNIKNRSIIQFSIPPLRSGSYRLWAYGYKKNYSQSIGADENKGHDIRYANPVLTYTNLGAWSGAETSQSFQLPNGDIDGIAILAQENGYGPIIAAGKIDF